MEQTASVLLETPTSLADWVLVLPIVLCLMGAALLLIVRRNRTVPLPLTIAVILAVIICDAALLLHVSAQGPLSMTMGRWLPPFGISLTADLFSAAFALTAAVVTLVVVLYAPIERADTDDREGFLALVLLLLGGVSGAFLTGDLFNLYVWFEVMLIASFGLLVQGHGRLQLDAAIKYGFLNFLATTFFLLALGLLYGLLGTLNMADIIGVAPLAHPGAMAGVGALLLLAFGMKAAAFPVNAWLPASYHAPPAVISALFAGLLTKVGAYALLRGLVAVLPASRDLLEPALALIAIATLLIAPLGAIAETNLRRAMGFLVIGGIGAVMAGLAVASQAGIAGAGFYIFHALLTMTALYLVAGLIERRTGATDTRAMGGLYAATAPLSILFFVLILAAAGVPPFLGFWPKLLLLQAGIGQGLDGASSWVGTAIALALLVNAVLTLIAGTRLWAHIFWRQEPLEPKPKTVIEPLPTRAAPGVAAVMVLTALIVLGGLWPAPLMEGANVGAAGIIDPTAYRAATNLWEGAP
jgi:multicomponent Na+:H+ antiporter subunit D